MIKRPTATALTLVGASALIYLSIVLVSVLYVVDWTSPSLASQIGETVTLCIGFGGGRYGLALLIVTFASLLAMAWFVIRKPYWTNKSSLLAGLLVAVIAATCAMLLVLYSQINPSLPALLSTAFSLIMGFYLIFLLGPGIVVTAISAFTLRRVCTINDFDQLPEPQRVKHPKRGPSAGSDEVREDLLVERQLGGSVG